MAVYGPNVGMGMTTPAANIPMPNIPPMHAPVSAAPAYTMAAPAYPAHACPPAIGVVPYSSTGIILVLFILLVIISRAHLAL